MKVRNNLSNLVGVKQIDHLEISFTSVASDKIINKLMRKINFRISNVVDRVHEGTWDLTFDKRYYKLYDE